MLHIKQETTGYVSVRVSVSVRVRVRCAGVHYLQVLQESSCAGVNMQQLEQG